ncbi:MAG: hypothetical protein HAW62_04770 [Endozoicomonadaceae bacterium]|nr:hypothetical protein [Endozoicomonadaceae bacterium]
MQHPHIAGIILFSRNYQNNEQFNTLILEIKSIRPEILLSVDQEGGLVQRFKSSSFTKPPAPERLAIQYEQDQETAKQCEKSLGIITSFELQQHQIDINFSPVLDIHHGRNAMMKSRYFGKTARAVRLYRRCSFNGHKYCR